MKRFGFVAIALFAVITVGGCTATKTSDRRSDIGSERLPRPEHILVYDFAATPDEIATGSPEAVQAGEPAQQTAAEIATGHKLGVLVAKELVAEISAMGLTAHGGAGAFPRTGDIVIKGYFDSIDEGSVAKRVMLGFGSGAAKLRTVVVGYQMTDQGLRRLGSAQIDSGEGKTPGLLLPIAVVAATANPIGLVVGGAVKVAGEASGRSTIEGSAKRTAKEIGEQLKIAFRKQGWIR